MINGTNIFTKIVASLLITSFPAFFTVDSPAQSAAIPYTPLRTIIWKLKDTSMIGGFKPLVLGTPSIVQHKKETALSFSGINDGLIIPVNPVEGWTRFTVEVLFNPAADGPAAPRFVHFQDALGNRGTLEIRVTSKGMWYADTFLRNGKTEKGLTLIDSVQQHPCNQWYWLALVYDGKKMSHYVNAGKELEGLIDFPPMSTGQISLGVRLNKVNWFKGQIKEIRFHPVALNRKALKRTISTF